MLWEDVDLTLIEVGGFRSLRGGMGRCSGSGRSFSIVESVERERWVWMPRGRLLRECQEIKGLKQSECFLSVNVK
jgi:hypothetical protein